MANMKVNPDYHTLKNWLSNKSTKVLGNNTIAQYNPDNTIDVILHRSIIATLSDHDIKLYSAGYKTLTTKERINQVLPYPFRVYQENRIWYLYNWKSQDKWLFTEGITINLLDNIVTDFGQDSLVEDTKTLTKNIKAYCKAYINELFNGNVEIPSGGDCWYCSLREIGSGVPVGELNKDKDHILLHIEEGYYVPSLIARAIEVKQVSRIAQAVLYNFWVENKQDCTMFYGIAQDQLYKSLFNYLCQYMGV